MSNHFHLVIQALQTTLSEIMHLLQTRFAVIYNQNRERAGHVFQGRYLPLLIQDDAYLMTVLRYVHLNPVAAGIVEFPEQWPLSGHNELIGLAKADLVDTGLALEYFGDDLASARAGYRRFVYAKLSHPDLVLPKYEGLLDAETPASKPSIIGVRTDLETMAANMGALAGISPRELLTSRDMRAASARKALILDAFQGGYRISEIARFLKVSPAYVSRIASRVES